MRELGLPEDIVNVEGNAIAHGHPIGATGALQIRTGSAFARRLQRHAQIAELLTVHPNPEAPPSPTSARRPG